ncbi:MAG TPA: energy transducer TonB [Elusimicrobiales bacterium]|jgi:outer membrane biosynthesis protein TonB|nr:energy transducer TonB [Elusimicrobiales bacterium]HPO95931.1 energy transducer TonB [Elusimicrobiales bacterium]
MDKKFFLIFCFSFIVHLSLLLVPFGKVSAFNNENNVKINYFSIKRSNYKRYAKVFDSEINREKNPNNIEKNASDFSETDSKNEMEERGVAEFEMNDLNGPKIYDFNPKYPFALKKIKKEGSVKIKLLIDENGFLVDKEIIYYTDDLFLKSVLEALHKARFSCAVINGKPIKSYGVLNIIFKLEE